MSDLNWDAFSDGQIRSKLWLCEALEALFKSGEEADQSGLNIWVMGGWYGLLPFLLFSRRRLPVRFVRSFDLDPAANQIAEKINNTWVIENRFCAHEQDVRELRYDHHPERPDLVINTSYEHFSEDSWWQASPPGAWVAIQATDLPHTEHVRSVLSLQDLGSQVGSYLDIQFEDEKRISYPELSFTRFMMIGRKKG